MATTLKRILAVIALIAVVFTVGFLVFTGNRLGRYPNAREDFENKTYLSDDGDRVAFTADNTAYYTVGDNQIKLMITDYKDGVIYAEKDEASYMFVAIGGDTLYDAQEKKFFYRRGGA